MEGKLIKTGEQFLLRNKEDEVIAITSGTMEGGMLSLKNCEAIANGYDLVELFDEVDESIDYQEFDFSSFKLGFKKAIELLGDKKFSEEDVISMIEKSRETGLSAEYLILTKQQTEFDVVVEMDIDNPCPKCGEKDNVHGNYDYSNITRPLINTLCNECGTYFSPIPKLDENKCLILKRK
jgi:hypothetical protein